MSFFEGQRPADSFKTECKDCGVEVIFRMLVGQFKPDGKQRWSRPSNLDGSVHNCKNIAPSPGGEWFDYGAWLSHVQPKLWALPGYCPVCLEYVDNKFPCEHLLKMGFVPHIEANNGSWSYPPFFAEKWISESKKREHERKKLLRTHEGKRLLAREQMAKLDFGTSGLQGTEDEDED